MSYYQYKVRTGSGALETGVIDSVSIHEASKSLRAQGKFVVNLVAQAQRDDLEDKVVAAKPFGKRSVKLSEVASFAHQISIMVDTGVSLSEALHVYVEQLPDGPFRDSLSDLYKHVNAGGELSAGMSERPDVFPVILVSLVRAAELSGSLGEMLDKASDYLANEQRTIRRVKGALTYPAVMLGLVFVVTLFLVMFVLPSFAGIYSNRGAILPAPTRILMWISEYMQAWWHVSFGVMLLGAGAGWLFLRTEFGRIAWDTAKLRMPVFGKLYHKLFITRSFRTMGTMLNAGVPILDVVAIVRLVAPNYHFQKMWAAIDENLCQGKQFSAGIVESEWIPKSVAQMVLSGERSGRVPDVMQKIATFTEEELDEQIRVTTQMIEPAITVLLGGIIGFIAIALLLPIFSAGQVMAG